MLVKVRNGIATRMIHEGVRYYFNQNEVKDCPESILAAFRGVLVSAEPVTVVKTVQPRIPIIPQRMPIIQVEQPKIKIPVKIKKSNVKKKTK